jgi:hypothetical protein
MGAHHDVAAGQEKTKSQVCESLGNGGGEEGQKCKLFGGAVLMRLTRGRQHESAR